MPQGGVLITKMFHPMDFELVLIKVRENLGDCSKLGPVRKLLLLERHPDVLRKLSVHSNLRWKVFGGHRFPVETWDGTTNGQAEKTPRGREERLREGKSFFSVPRPMEAFCVQLPSLLQKARLSKVRHFQSTRAHLG